MVIKIPKFLESLARYIIWVWTVGVYIIVAMVEAQEIRSIITGETVIYNFWWILGLIPAVFILLYYYSNVVYINNLALGRIAGLAGLVTSLIFITIQFYTSPAILVVIAFGFFVFIKSVFWKRNTVNELPPKIKSLVIFGANTLLLVSLLSLFSSYFQATLDESDKALEWTGGTGPVMDKFVGLVLTAIFVLFFHKSIFSHKKSFGSILSKIIFALLLIFGIFLFIAILPYSRY